MDDTTTQTKPAEKPDTTEEKGLVPMATERKSNAKTLGIVSYITWVGFIIALIVGDWKNDELLRKNINQALVLNLFSLLDFIPVIGWIWAIVVCVLWIMALVGACSKDGFKTVPILGGLTIIS